LLKSYNAELAAPGCSVAYIAFGQVQLREMTVELVKTSLITTRNMKPSRLGFVLHSRGMAISGRAAANRSTWCCVARNVIGPSALVQQRTMSL